MLKSLVIGVHLCLSVAYSDLLIRDVTIVDVSTGTVHPRHSILIRGERIRMFSTNTALDLLRRALLGIV